TMLVITDHTHMFCCLLFFFSSRRRHTRSTRDWSSDVCSSDLGELPFVVTHAQVFGGRKEFDLMARDVNVPLAPSAHGATQREHASFPALVENRLVFFFVNRAHAVHAAHVMHAVHAELPFCGATLATPTMASRVTSVASCSSLI